MPKGQEHLLTFHVVDGSAKPLLSANTCELFGLLTFHVQQAELCNTLESFADVFPGTRLFAWGLSHRSRS